VLLTLGLESGGGKWQEEEEKFWGGTGYLGNGLSVLTPNGKKLDGDMWAVWRAWSRLPLAERQKLDDLGRYDPNGYPPKPPPGGLVLRLYRRALEREGDGHWVRPRRIVNKDGGVHASEPQMDHVWLTAAEVRALAPDGRTVGEQYAAPAAVADRLGRFYLIDATTGITEQWYWKPAEVISQQLNLTVVQATADTVELLLHGTAAYAPEDRAAARVTYRLQGRATYERAAKTFARFDVVALSEAGHLEAATGKRQALAVAFELVRGTWPADRVPPFFINVAGYWGPAR
jgi:hypothetical protein